jgi:hypothetical protein
MIAHLVRQDPAFRRLPLWAGVALLQVGVAAAVLAWTTSRGTTLSLTVITALIWVPVMLYLVFGEIGTRASRFHLALPLPARQLWLSHLIAVGLTGVAVLAIAAALTASVLILQRRLVGGEVLGVETLVAGGGLLVAGLILAVVIVQAFRPGAQDVPLSARRAGWSLLAAAVSCGATLLLWPLGALGAIILAAAGATGIVATYRRLPVVLSLPDRDEPAAAADGAVPVTADAWIAATPPGGLWMALRTVHGVSTCAKKSFVMWIIVPFLVLMGFLMSVDVRPESDRFAYPFMLVYIVMVVTALSVTRLGVIDWLPWSRRRSFALLTVPLFLAAVIGYGAGSTAQALGARVFGGGEQLCMAQNGKTGDYFLCVLPSASRISWSGDVPAITTPWGETREPWNRPVFKGLPARAYFPYSVHSGSTPEFAALQISRAVEDLFGTHIPPDEIQARYLSERSDGTVAPAAGGITLQEDYPGLHATGGAVYFPWLMAEVVVLWALLMAGSMLFLRNGVSARRRKVMAWVFIAIPLILWMLDMYLEAFGISAPMARNTLFIELSRAAGATVTGTAATWLVSALVAWGAYRLAERRFERAELDATPPGACAID